MPFAAFIVFVGKWRGDCFRHHSCCHSANHLYLAANFQIKIERTKKRGEKLKSCSLDIVKILQLIIHHLVYPKNITNFAEMYKDEFIKEWHRRFD